MSRTKPRTRFVQGVDLLTEQAERAALRRAKKVTGKKRGFSQYVRGLIAEDFDKASKR